MKVQCMEYEKIVTITTILAFPTITTIITITTVTTIITITITTITINNILLLEWCQGSKAIRLAALTGV